MLQFSDVGRFGIDHSATSTSSELYRFARSAFSSTTTGLDIEIRLFVVIVVFASGRFRIANLRRAMASTKNRSSYGGGGAGSSALRRLPKSTQSSIRQASIVSTRIGRRREISTAADGTTSDSSIRAGRACGGQSFSGASRSVERAGSFVFFSSNDL